MHVDFEFLNDICILRLRGRFVTGSNREYLRTKERLEDTGSRAVIADCRELPYLDSTGIAFVVGLYNGLKESGGRLVIINANPRVREVLGVTRLDGMIPTFEDEEAALAALGVRRAPSRAFRAQGGFGFG